MSSGSSEQHRKEAARSGPIAIAVITVSDSRTEETDRNGIYLKNEIEAAGHTLAGYRIIHDEPSLVTAAAEELAGRGRARIILFNGGTGISSRDNTFDALSELIEKSLPGFGELFRMLSWEQVGAAAMLSRATAGVFRDSVIISTPGSPAAVKLAWEKLILPEISHLAWELGR
mgnify:CR=1 FL=1